MKYISTLRVQLLGNAVYDNMWCTHKRPEKLVMRHNDCDDAFPDWWIGCTRTRAQARARTHTHSQTHTHAHTLHHHHHP